MSQAVRLPVHLRIFLQSQPLKATQLTLTYRSFIRQNKYRLRPLRVYDPRPSLHPVRAYSAMATADDSTRGGKPVLASQRTKEEAEARGEKPRSRFANVFPLSYKETFTQWVSLCS